MLKRLSILGLGVSVALASLSLPTGLCAQEGAAGAEQLVRDPFAALVGKRSRARDALSARGVSRYVLAADDRALVFEERFDGARVTFLCGAGDPRLDCTLDPDAMANEIFLLSATRGPRGDVIYRSVEGAMRLRIASYGGATVYWPGEHEGAAASKSFGDDAALRLKQAAFEDAARRAAAAEAHLVNLISSRIKFDLSSSRANAEGDAAVLADAVVRAAIALSQVAADPIGKAVLAERLRRVSFIAGDGASLALDGRRLIISYAPDRDVRGRPASVEIVQFLEASL